MPKADFFRGPICPRQTFFRGLICPRQTFLGGLICPRQTFLGGADLPKADFFRGADLPRADLAKGRFVQLPSVPIKDIPDGLDLDHKSRIIFMICYQYLLTKVLISSIY